MALCGALRRLASAPAMPGELVGLQYLRGIAALMVVLDHGSGMIALPHYLGREPFGGLLKTGRVGVDLFFCISGFIIVYASLHADGTPRHGIAEYARRRFARIVPFLWFAVLLYAALKYVGRGPGDFVPYLRALALFPIGDLEPNVVWTLRHEMLFYAVFAVAFLASPRMRRYVGIPFLAIWLTGPIASAAAGLGGAGAGWELARFLLNPVNLLFGMGMAAAFLFFRVGRHGFSPFWQRTLLIGLLVGLMPMAGILHYDRLAIGPILLIGLASSFSIFLAALVAHGGGMTARLGKLLGDASYSVYLTHTLFISIMLSVATRYAPGMSPEALLAILFIVATLGGVALRILVEKPLVDWTRSLLRRGTQSGRRRQPQAVLNR